MNSRHRPLTLTVRALLGLPVAGAVFTSYAADSLKDRDALPTVTVSATAISEDPENIASSFSVLEGEQLFERTQATLGDTLNGIPSVIRTRSAAALRVR